MDTYGLAFLVTDHASISSFISREAFVSVNVHRLRFAFPTSLERKYTEQAIYACFFSAVHFPAV